jgi:ketosteroid isomerase-like protein
MKNESSSGSALPENCSTPYVLVCVKQRPMVTRTLLHKAASDHAPNCVKRPFCAIIAVVNPRRLGGIMRSVCRALLLMSLVFFQVWAQNQNANAAPSAEEEIKSLEQERNVAILNGDAAALDRMTADDYTFITLRGELRTKSEIVKGFQSGSFKYESRQISDLNIRVYGDTAVVTGRSNQKGMENGKDYSGDYRFTRVYVRQKGRWLTVALQATAIKP